MNRMIRTLLLSCAFLCCSAVSMDSATACPMCKTANETDDARPKAYMYSILFMLSMPAMMFSGFGFAFYRLSRKARLAQEAEILAGSADASGHVTDSSPAADGTQRADGD